jgi:hypothetical protein
MPDGTPVPTIQSWYDLIYKMAKDWGFPTALSCALIWVGYQEHRHQSEVLQITQTFIQTQLTEVIVDNSTRQMELKNAVDRLTDSINRSTFTSSQERGPH